MKPFLIFVAAILLVATVRANEKHSAPSGVGYELIGTYSVERLNQVLTSERASFSNYAVTYAPARLAVKLYRVTYPSVVPEQNNRPTVASGLLALPENAKDGLPVVSYQHGTVFSKTEVPSRPDAYRWRSVTPLRTYYGEADEVTPPFIASLPVGYQKITGGAETTGVQAPGQATHRGTFLFAIGDQKKWFDGLLKP